MRYCFFCRRLICDVCMVWLIWFCFTFLIWWGICPGSRVQSNRISIDNNCHFKFSLTSPGHKIKFVPVYFVMSDMAMETDWEKKVKTSGQQCHLDAIFILLRLRSQMLCSATFQWNGCNNVIIETALFAQWLVRKPFNFRTKTSDIPML